MDELIELLEEAKEYNYKLLCHHDIGYRFDYRGGLQKELDALLTDSNLTNIEILISIKKSGIKTEPME